MTHSTRDRAIVSLVSLGLFLATAFPYAAAQSTNTATSTDTTATSTAEDNGPTEAEVLRYNLENQIKQKSQELNAVNQQLDKTSQDLQKTQSEKVSLQREVNTIQYNINQLELNIQSDQITSQKLSLEIDSLNYDIRDIELQVGKKNDAVAYILRQLQQQEGESPLIIFLRNESLADGFWASQSLKNLRTQLAVDIATLSGLHDQMNAKLSEISSKKTDIDTNQINLTARKSIVEDQKSTRSALLSQTKNKEATYQQQVADLRDQQNAISDEISDIENQLRAAFDTSLLPIARPGVLAWPIKLVSEGGTGRITQHFGETSYLYHGKPHNGLDIGAPIGTPVYAADDGVVLAVDNNDRSSWSKYQYGKYVLIKHNNSLATLYGHLSKQAVTTGQSVKRGDLIGYVGETGYATGPHLHLGVYWAPSVTLRQIPPAAGLVPLGVVIDPEDYL